MNRSRYNILLITSDQQHWNTLGITNPEISTPNLDRLATSGTLFDRAYCPNPTCTPTRASIITGKYPSQHGAWALGTKLPEDEYTVGDALQADGYRTALVGKAHFQPVQSTEEFNSLESMGILQDLDFWRNFNGPFYGFDHVELARNHTDEYLVGQHYVLWMEKDLIRVPFIASCPGTIPSDRRCEALQSLVDLAPTFLSFAGADVPRPMTGLDQRATWCGHVDQQRDHIIVENRHQPTTIHVKTYVDQRSKMTIYYNQDYGDLFDLRADPDELHNRWNDPGYADIKSALLLRLIHAEMGKEPLWMPRIAIA